MIYVNDNSLEEELLEYIELNRNKVQYVWIDELKMVERTKRSA